MFGALVRGVRGKLRAVGGTTRFDFGGFFGGQARYFRGRNFFLLGRFVFGLFFGFFFLKFGATNNGIRFGFGLGFLVLGFDEAGSESGDLIVAQFNVTTNGFRFVGKVLV